MARSRSAFRQRVALVAALVSGLGTTAAVVWSSPSVADTTTPTPIYLNTSYSFAERAADLVSRMTLAEKVVQLRTNSAPAIPRLGVQQYTYWSEGQHGINRLGANTNNGGVGGGPKATSFPTNFAATMSWDPSLTYQETTAISDEARGELDKSLWGTGQNNIGPSQSDYGSLTYWAPTVNLDRDPRWGRTDEAFGEDPYLVGQMAGAFVDGYQGETMNGQPTSKYLKVAATAKHYALNDVEDNRQSGSSDTTDANIRDYYTAQFKSLIEDSHVSGLMTSYNAVNGTPAPANTYTVNELAQRTYGFNGYTTSDCGAVNDIYNPSRHNWAPPGWTTSTSNGSAVWTNTATGQTVSGAAGGQAYAERAGTQLNCTGAEETLANITEAINAGVLSEGVIDNALVHLFTLRMETGEFDPPSSVPYTSITKDQIQSPAHQALAQKVADNSLVLLKNDNVSGSSTPLLPADPSKLNSVVIVGSNANTVQLGGYSGSPTYTTNSVQGITAAVKAANPNASVTFDACGTSTTATAAASCSAATQAAIKSADLVIVFVGTDANVAGEGNDRNTLAMPGNYDSLINQVNALGNPNMALMIQSDGPVKIDDVQGDFPAIVFSGYNGQSQGTALADVLFGKQNPSGHLDFTWFKDDSQLPDMQNYGLTPSQTGGLGRTYQYFTGTPTYPFGYGLSYSSFAYSHVKVDPKATTADGQVNVHFDVTNTGTVPGTTVAQVYVATPFSVPGVELPIKRLEGFQKTAVLAPGQTQSIAIPVKISDLALWDAQQHKDVVYDGSYQFQVATDATDLVGADTVAVTGAITPRVSYVTVQPDQVEFTPGQHLDLTGTNPWIADDTGQAAQHVPADDIVEAVNNDESFVDLAHAHVSYASSNPNVATVTPSGTVQMIAAGTATISATVNGVTGSTPVVVTQPFTLDAPNIASPGSTLSATTTLPNPSSAPLSNVSMSLNAPNGWQVQAASPSSFATVAPGQTVRTTWSISVPSDADPGNYDLSAQVDYTNANGEAVADAATTTSVPFASFASAFDNPGITDNSNFTAGNLDGAGRSYSAQALAATGLTPGGTVTHDGLTYTWPNVPSGTPDDVVAGGQTIPISGSGSTLGLIGAANNGTATGTGTITYTDGSTQPFNLSLADWWANSPAAGSDTLVTMPVINNQSGANVSRQVSVYAANIPLQPSKTVAYLTLPDISDGVANGQIAMHLFAVSVGGYGKLSASPSSVVTTPGTSTTVSATYTNNGPVDLDTLALSLRLPTGWTAQPTTSTSFTSVLSGQQVSASWQVTAPGDATPGRVDSTLQADYSAHGSGGVTATSVGFLLTYPSLAAAFNNVGVTDDSNRAPGNFDTGANGDSYSANALANLGITPGSTITERGVAFTWPDVPAGVPDNVTFLGQPIALSGSGTTLGILGAGVTGTHSGTATVFYTDGSTQQATITYSDWFGSTPAPGDDLVATMPYLNSRTLGQRTIVNSLYAAYVQLDPTRTVEAVQLPNVPGGGNGGDKFMHAFSMAIGG